MSRGTRLSAEELRIIRDMARAGRSAVEIARACTLLGTPRGKSTIHSSPPWLAAKREREAQAVALIEERSPPRLTAWEPVAPSLGIVGVEWTKGLEGSKLTGPVTLPRVSILARAA